MISSLPILYEDDHLVAINKPAGLLIHRTKISEDTVFALQLLRDQLGQRIYPIHRLDRATSGVLLFGKTKEATAQVSIQMRARSIKKQYIAIIRGYVEPTGTIDSPLSNKDKPHLPPKEATTHFTKLDQSELNFSVNRYPTSRYSLVSIRLETGRKHQIRRHFAHVRHPIIGDKKHGDCKHNKYFEEQFGLRQMMLHAERLECMHPVENKALSIEALIPEVFLGMMERLGLEIKD